MKYEDFVRTTDMREGHDDTYFYYFGMNEENGEISGIFKRIARGDHDTKKDRPSDYLQKNGIAMTVNRYPWVRRDLVREMGDKHWYETRFLNACGITWDQIREENVSKLKKRKELGMIAGHGGERECE